MILVSYDIIFVFASHNILILYLFWFDDRDSYKSQTKMEPLLYSSVSLRGDAWELSQTEMCSTLQLVYLNSFCAEIFLKQGRFWKPQRPFGFI